MKLLWCLTITIALFLKGMAQEETGKTSGKKNTYMKVITDQKIYKGSLYYVNDSSIRYVRGMSEKDLPISIAAKDIHQIEFRQKHQGIINGLGGMLLGGLFGLFIPYKLEDNGIYMSDKAYLYGFLSGAGIGLIVGAASAKSGNIIIPINRNQQQFEQKKSQLKGMSIY
jgi:hypothetical protein